MKIISKLICENAFHSKESNNLNVIGIFEEIYASKFPASHPKISFVVIAEGGPGEKFDYQMRIADPTGKVIFDSSDKPMNSAIGPNGRVHVIFNIINLPLSMAGSYTATIHTGDTSEDLKFGVRTAPVGSA